MECALYGAVVVVVVAAAAAAAVVAAVVSLLSKVSVHVHDAQNVLYIPTSAVNIAQAVRIPGCSCRSRLIA